jgi:DNA-binding LacI/PurR family transcriptional regulator
MADVAKLAGVVRPALVGDWSARSGYELGRLLAADPEVTAVFVGNEMMALGLLPHVRVVCDCTNRDDGPVEHLRRAQ